MSVTDKRKEIISMNLKKEKLEVKEIANLIMQLPAEERADLKKSLILAKAIYAKKHYLKHHE